MNSFNNKNDQNNLPSKSNQNTDKKNKDIFIEDVYDTVNIGEGFTISSRSLRTNRTVTLADSQNETDSAKLQKMIVNFVENNSNDLFSYVEKLVIVFNQRLEMKETTFYRAIEKSKETSLSSKQIGPSPNSSAGRYNNQGQKCIYLSDSYESLRNELKTNSILIQKYLIPIDKLKIADLSSSNKSLNNSLGLVFDMTENGKTSSGYNFEEILGKKGKCQYCISQEISNIFLKNGWEGLYIPGVHGTKEKYYNNLVIFNEAVKQWHNWAIGEYFLE